MCVLLARKPNKGRTNKGENVDQAPICSTRRTTVKPRNQRKGRRLEKCHNHPRIFQVPSHTVFGQIAARNRQAALTARTILRVGTGENAGAVTG